MKSEAELSGGAAAIHDRGLRPLAEAIGRRARAPAGSALLFVILVGAWHSAVATGQVDEIILPYPADVAKALVDTFQDDFFYRHLWITVREVIIGFAVGSAIGFSLGTILGVSKFARDIAAPYIVGFQGLPKIVLAPIFVTVFGFGIESKIAMAVAISFFPLLVNTVVGLTTVDPDATKLMRSMMASRVQIYRKLALPHALPLIFAGLKTGLTLALIGAIVAEFVGASRGLGYLLEVYTYQLLVPRQYAIMVILAALGVILYLSIEWLERKVVHWRTGEEGGASGTM